MATILFFAHNTLLIFKKVFIASKNFKRIFDYTKKVSKLASALYPLTHEGLEYFAAPGAVALGTQYLLHECA